MMIPTLRAPLLALEIRIKIEKGETELKIEIKSRYTGQIIVSGEWETLRDCVMQNKSNLRDAYLQSAGLQNKSNLRGADLQGADLGGADLRGADLRGADLGGADLRGADLRGADLQSADLGGAYLGGGDLEGVYLRGADLRGAKEYKNSHDIFAEIIRRQGLSVFTAVEWQAIGVIIVHRICWNEIQMMFSDVMGGIFQKLAAVGFSEWLDHWKTIR